MTTTNRRLTTLATSSLLALTLACSGASDPFQSASTITVKDTACPNLSVSYQTWEGQRISKILPGPQTTIDVDGTLRTATAHRCDAEGRVTIIGQRTDGAFDQNSIIGPGSSAGVSLARP